jgi:hypothetical protein
VFDYWSIHSILGSYIHPDPTPTKNITKTQGAKIDPSILDPFEYQWLGLQEFLQ